MNSLRFNLKFNLALILKNKHETQVTLSLYGSSLHIHNYKNKQSELRFMPIEDPLPHVYSKLTSSITACKEVYEFCGICSIKKECTRVY